MLNKFLNKEVEITEKLFEYSSTLGSTRNTIVGVVTAIDDNFIELNNNTLIAIKYIYIITLAK